MIRNGMMHETDVGSVASANNSVGMINGSGTHASAGAQLAQAMAGSGVLVFWNLFTTFNATCQCMGDMSLAEYCVLASVCRQEEGLPIKELASEKGASTGHYESQLLKKELIKRIRNSKDRRELAYSATPKGSLLARRLDHALALGLMGRYEALTEASFSGLVERMRDYDAALAAAMAADWECDRLFPASALWICSGFQRVASYEASRFSMTFLHMATLAFLYRGALDKNRGVDLGDPVSIDRVCAAVGVDPSHMELVLEDCTDKGLVLVTSDEACEACRITEAGAQRYRLFEQRALQQVAQAFSARLDYVEGIGVGHSNETGHIVEIGRSVEASRSVEAGRIKGAGLIDQVVECACDVVRFAVYLFG